MTIRLFDTMAGTARELVPIEPGHVRVYSCGPTVYGPAHIGNFRSFLSPICWFATCATAASASRG